MAVYFAQLAICRDTDLILDKHFSILHAKITLQEIRPCLSQAKCSFVPFVAGHNNACTEFHYKIYNHTGNDIQKLSPISCSPSEIAQRKDSTCPGYHQDLK